MMYNSETIVINKDFIKCEALYDWKIIDKCKTNRRDKLHWTSEQDGTIVIVKPHSC